MLPKLLNFNHIGKLAMVAATVAGMVYVGQWFAQPGARNADDRQTGAANIGAANPAPHADAAAAAVPTVPYRFDVDTDGDGLADAKEFVYGTDPHAADTDGDGYSDGGEVANGYDPSIAGSARIAQKPANLTQRYLAWAKQPAALDTIHVITFLSREPDLAFRLPEVTPAELRIAASPDIHQLAQYRAAVAALELPRGFASYNDLARDALADRFTETDRIATELAELAASWQMREVPAQTEATHAKLVGLLGLARELFTDLHAAKTDPVRIIWNMERGRALAAVAQDIQREAAALKQ